jgi:outer membrane protein assembly factor BamA
MASYEGQRLASLVLAGRPDLNVNDLMKVVIQKPGEPFSNERIQQSITNLKDLGHFNDVTVEIRPLSNGVNVRLVLQPALYLGIYTFPGADRFAYSRLLQAAEYPVKTAYSNEDVDTAQKGLTNLFQKTGYFTVKVRPEILPDFHYGLVNVTFHINLGKRAKFGKVNFNGASPELATRLTDAMHSRFRSRIRGAHLKTGDTYTSKRIENVTQFLQNVLIGDGFLASRITFVGANYNPQTNYADVDFKVVSGPKVHIAIQGAHVWGRTQRRLIPIVADSSIQEGVITEGKQNLISHFQSKGFFDVEVDPRVVRQPNNIRITYNVRRGRRSKVEDISLHGNRHISSDELMPQIAVQRASVIPFLSHGRFSEQLVRRSINNLETVYKNAGYANAKVVPEVSREKNRNVSVRFTVDEGPLDVAQSFRVEGNKTVTLGQLAPQGLRVLPGKAYSQFLVQQDRNQILATYLNLGYLNASFTSSAKPSSSDPHQFDVLYKVVEGPHVHVARVITVGRQHTRQSLIDTVAKIKSEESLSETDLLAAETRLYTLSIFDWAEVDPRTQVTTQSDEDVVIKLHEDKRNQITYGFGFEVINRGGSVPSGTVAVPGIPPVGLPSNFKTSEKTFWGPRGSIEYNILNMRGRAETLTLSALAGRLLQRGSLTYYIPLFRNSSWNASGNINGEHNSENPIFTSVIGEGGFQFQRFLDTKRTKSVVLRYNLSYTALPQLLIPDLVPPSDRNVRLSTVSGTFSRDTRDNPIDAPQGYVSKR